MSVTETEPLNVRDGASLGTQVWVAQNGRNHALSASEFEPITANEIPTWKPRKGGLWTAQWDERWGGGWVQWCLSEQYDGPTWKYVWLLDPEPAARVLVIDSYDDLARAFDRWPHRDERYDHRDGYLAWHRIAEEFDAVHVTEEGQWRTRLTHPLNLYGWDCESTVWFRWAFTSAREVGERTFEAKPWDDDEPPSRGRSDA